MDTLSREIRFAIRRLAGERSWTLAAVLILALGTGANTAMFSMAYSLLVRPLPYPDPGGIVRVGESFGGREPRSLSNRSMLLLQDAEVFEQLAAYKEHSVEWTGRGGAVTLRGGSVSPALFLVLRARVQLGRFFREEEAREGVDRVVLLSHRTWTDRFGADPDVVGTVIHLDGEPHTVVGVLVRGFYFPDSESEFWVPYVVPPFTAPVVGEAGQLRMRFVTTFSALGRLAAGVSPERAATEVRVLLQNNEAGDPGTRAAGGGSGIDVRVVPLLDDMVGEYRPALLALTTATTIVLLMACVNVAGLWLARGAGRERAMAVCAALGASRGRLVREVLVESVVLSGGGGVLGVAMAGLMLGVVPSVVPGDVARLGEVGIDGVTLLFALALSIAAGLMLGVVPALRWSRVELMRAGREGSGQSAGGRRVLGLNRARATVVVAQVALALVLLVGAILLLRSFVRLVTVDRGYDSTNVVAARARDDDLAVPRGMTQELLADFRAASWRFQESLLVETLRLESLSEVEVVGIATRLPLVSDDRATTTFRVAGTPRPGDPRNLLRASLNFVSPGYFDVMRLRLRSGRFYTGVDGAESSPVLVVNETLARQLFGSREAAVGQRVLLAGSAGEPWEVIGVVDDVFHGGTMITRSEGEAFVSLHQAEQMPGFFFSASVVAVRTAGDPGAVVPFLREAVSAASPGASIDEVMTMDARLSTMATQPGFYVVLVGFFAAVALFIAASGIYALVNYTVLERRREIGIRMALGAQRGDILALVARPGAGVVAAGTLLGLLLAAASVRLLESFVFGVAVDDGLTFMAASFVVALVALVAFGLPGVTATQVNPMDALRAE